MSSDPLRRTITVYRYRTEWGGKLKLSKHYLPLDQIEALGGIPVMTSFREIAIPHGELSTGVLLRNRIDSGPEE